MAKEELPKESDNGTLESKKIKKKGIKAALKTLY